MAGNIQGIDKIQLKNAINQYGARASELKSNLYWIDNCIDLMIKNWTGKRMNKIINIYNNMCDSLYRSAKFFDEDVRNILQNIYQQYLKMEDEGITINFTSSTAGFVPVSIKTKITLTDENHIHFIEKDVLDIQTRINKYFSKVLEVSNILVSSIDVIGQYSDSLANLKEVYTKHAISIKDNLTMLKETLEKNISEAINIVRTAERYNESSVNELK